MDKQGYNDRMDERLGMKDGAERYKKQHYKARRDESRGMAKADVKMKNERYMPKGMDKKVMGHEKKPKKVDVLCGEGFKEVKPFKDGNKGYPRQAFDYKY